MDNTLSKQVIKDLVHYTKYAKIIQSEERKESYEETVTRNKAMHLKKFADKPEVCELIDWAYDFVYKQEVVPSMRSMQFAGNAIFSNPARMFNCCFLHMDSVDSVGELMFLLLSGVGVGYSVQYAHIKKLPHIKKLKVNPRTGLTRKRRYLIADNIEGWADAIKFLLKSYFEGLSEPVFDYSSIRKKGERLKTSGGMAPGPQPLKECIVKIKGILDSKEVGSKLTSLEIHDIACHCADAVLAGGVRRSAMCCLFSFDDVDMLTCKSGNWWELNPQRGRANNSATILRHRVSKEDLEKFWDFVVANNSGEPGMYFTNNADWGFNPCFEASLRFGQFCNLTTLNALAIDSQEKFNDLCKAATIIGTLQASYTDFHYIREFWRETTEKDALIGVSITGIACGSLDNLDLSEGAQVVLETNETVSGMLGINKAARTTLLKPEGSTSLIFGSASGIHDWYDNYYIRRITILKDDPIYPYLMEKIPDLMEDNVFKPHLESFAAMPMKANSNGYIDSSTFDMLERVRRYSVDWIKSGHRTGDNMHNVSCTIFVSKHEWSDVLDWIWDNRNDFACMSFFPKDDTVYTQAPHETIDKEEYDRRLSMVGNIDLKEVSTTKETDFTLEAACAGGACEII